MTFCSSHFRDPITVSLCMAIGGTLAVLIQVHDTNVVTLKPTWVCITIVLMNEMISAEKLFIKSVHRGLGTLIGSAFGTLICWGVTSMPPDRTQRNVVRIAYLSVEAFIAAFLAKNVSPGNLYMFVVIGITSVLAVFSNNLFTATSRFVSVLFGIVCSQLCILIMHTGVTSSIVIRAAALGAKATLTTAHKVIQCSEGQALSLDEFTTLCDEIRGQFTVARSKWEIYIKWRRWTCRSIETDYSILVYKLRPLYHSSSALYYHLIYGGDFPKTFSELFGDKIIELSREFGSVGVPLSACMSYVAKDRRRDFTDMEMLRAALIYLMKSLSEAHLYRIKDLLTSLEVKYISLRWSMVTRDRWWTIQVLASIWTMVLNLSEYLLSIWPVLMDSAGFEPHDPEALDVLESLQETWQMLVNARDLVVDESEENRIMLRRELRSKSSFQGSLTLEENMFSGEVSILTKSSETIGK